MHKIFITLLLLLPGTLLQAQAFTEKITRELTFEKQSAANTLIVDNINGSIHVEAYTGDKILVTVTRSIRAKTAERLEEGKKKIQLGVINDVDTLILYTDGTCAGYGRTANNHTEASGSWGYTTCRECNERYEYQLDFSLRVPAGIHVAVSTVNNGDIVIENIGNALAANNVNGSIRLVNLTREARAHTINGNVDITYARNPDRECRFYTLNGDIHASFQKGLAANMSFESFNGELFTNIDKIEALPAAVQQVARKDGMKFKVGDNFYKIGAGGSLLAFETFNGNVYIKEQ
ncbi:DUF4097 family beta strand repeat-containing protein [Dawidia soli]|uniref:Adhesin domain-containing protein n=1 Tax=Dawidia soli TaxID=2782352 RepID=A0AAP2D9P7_9BACT|nr:hypothetical protein [Dawidia soli]MBT1687961.1 hypothetical protein [Dawidia soli]